MSHHALYLMLLLPVAGVLLNGFFGSRFSERAVSAIGVTAAGIPLLLAAMTCCEMLFAPASEKIFDATLYRWLSMGSFHIDVGFLLDPLSMVMVLVVLFVGFIIHVYSVSYMRGDPGFRRYFVYLNLFIFFMLILVMADNLVLIFVGWEGVGLCSYLLIGFWYEKKSAADAGRKAFIVNRVGDFGFILGLLLVVITFHTVNISEIKTILLENHGISVTTISIISTLLFIGAMGKSAQFPLHVWLPDAMEGPTPVSALIHAATMVNAGVYFMCRIAPLLQQSPVALPIIAAVGLVTAVYAALSALGQDDIKKVLAYSTISQIGFMFMAIGSGIYIAGMFHLVTHGIFKGLLFLGAGAVIHALHGEQNIYRMGGLSRHLPRVSAVFLIGLLALSGIFPLSGFFSKDAILWGGFERYGLSYWLLAVLAALVTTLYCGKLFGLVFQGNTRFRGSIHNKPDALIVVPLIILALCTVMAGVLGLPMFTENTLFARFVGESFTTSAGGHAAALGAGSHAQEIVLTVIVAIIAIAAFIFALRIFSGYRNKAERLSSEYPGAAMFMHAGFRIDKIYDVALVKSCRSIANACDAIMDRFIIDGAVNKAGSLAVKVGQLLAATQTGYVRYYAASIILGVFVFVCITYGFLT